jgi:hypothetical protein
MTVEIEHVRGMAHAFVEIISHASERDRDTTPNVPFCNRYNQILVLAKEAVPGIDERFWPSPIERQDISDTRYVDIQTYALQILNLLPPPPPPREVILVP